jgi:hypothetical protein
MTRYSTFRAKPSSLRRSGRLKAGRRTNDWIKIRRKLKVQYEAAGITQCELGYEGCKRDTWLSFAHGRKRRHLQGDELETLTILCCTCCHDKIEYLKPEEMLAIVRNVIFQRKAR